MGEAGIEGIAANAGGRGGKMTILVTVNGVDKEIVSTEACPLCGFPMTESVTLYGYDHDCESCGEYMQECLI